MAGASAPAVFLGSRPSAAAPPPDRAQEEQLKAPHRIPRSRRFPYLRLIAEQSSRPAPYPLRSSRQVCMMVII